MATSAGHYRRACEVEIHNRLPTGKKTARALKFRVTLFVFYQQISCRNHLQSNT